MRRWSPAVLALCALGSAVAADPPAPSPPAPPPQALPDVKYVGPDEVKARLERIAARPAWGRRTARLDTYGTSAGGRPLLVLRIGPEDAPQVLVHGGIGARDVAGTAAAFDFAERAMPEWPAGATVPPPDDRVGFMVIPAPNPDALAAFLAGRWGRGGGDVDRDRDGRKGEDGPDDLDGDGEILSMRRKTPGGTWTVDDAPAKPDGKRMGDPRLMKNVGVDARREGSYEVTDEGKDDDGDGEVNEDPPGTDLARNFMGVWEEAGAWPGEGPFPGSAPEVKALMDLSWETTRLVAWYAFVSEGPRIERASERGKDADADDALYGLLAPAWKKASGLETRKASERPGASDNPGSELDWAARDLGVVAARVPVWQIAKEEQYGRDRQDPDELDWLLWNDRVLKGAGFVAWHEVKHPQYGTVEVGGWKRFTRWEPPADLLADAVRKVSGVPLAHSDFAPRLSVLVETKDLGASTWRVTAKAENLGGAATDTKAAEKAERAMEVRLSLEPATGVEVLGGPRVAAVGVLPAGGLSKEAVWLVHAAAKGRIGRVTAFHRVAGKAVAEVVAP